MLCNSSIELLEGDVREKNEVIESRDDEISNLNTNCTGFQARIEELEISSMEYENEIRQLNETLEEQEGMTKSKDRRLNHMSHLQEELDEANKKLHILMLNITDSGAS